MNAPFSSLFEESKVIGKGIVAEAMTAHKELQKKKLAEVILQVVVAAESAMKNHVNILRGIRKQEKDALESIKKLERATEYFHETGNFGPLSACVHLDVYRALGVAPPTPEEQKIPEKPSDK